MLGGHTVADTRQPQLLYLPPPFSCYVFPEKDVRWEMLTESPTQGQLSGLGKTKQWTVRAGDKEAPDAAWMVADPPEGLEALSNLVAFKWRSMEAWFEEDDEVFVHPRDPYHRIDVLNSSRHVRVMVEGEVVADSHRPRLLFETHLPTRYYIPLADVRLDLLERSSTLTRCPYKGIASYWSVKVGGELKKDLAWTYELPIPESPKIENLVCFFNEKVDIEVDGEVIGSPPTPWSK
jgi:uncharacterized protein (DUF427 family)